MLREGIVLSNNPEQATVKVGFPPDENFFCTMKVAYAGTFGNKHFWLPQKGEKVICIMSDCHQWGYIIRSAYTPPVEAHKLPEGAISDKNVILELNDCEDYVV